MNIPLALSCNVTLVGSGRVSVLSVEAAVEYLRPRLTSGTPDVVTVYGPLDAFRLLHLRVRGAIEESITQDRSISERHMAESTAWADYVEAKAARQETSTRHDVNALWLRYGG